MMMTVHKHHPEEPNASGGGPDTSMLYQILAAAANLTGSKSAYIERLDPLTREVIHMDPKPLPGVSDQEPAHWDILHEAMLGVTADPRGA